VFLQPEDGNAKTAVAEKDFRLQKEFSLLGRKWFLPKMKYLIFRVHPDINPDVLAAATDYKTDADFYVEAQGRIGGGYRYEIRENLNSEMDFLTPKKKEKRMDKKIMAQAIDKLKECLDLVKAALLADAPAAAATATEAPTATPAKEEKAPAKRGRPKSDAKKEEPKEEEDDFGNDEAEEEEDDFAGLDDKKKEVTAEELRTKLVEFATKKSKDEAYKILAKFKAKKVNDLKPEQFAEVYAALEAGM